VRSYLHEETGLPTGRGQVTVRREERSAAVFRPRGGRVNHYFQLRGGGRPKVGR